MRPACSPYSRFSQHWRIVFRELLQNADDACSPAVEICFETKKYVDARGKSSVDKAPPSHDGRLPDLKTALVRGPRFSFCFPCLTVLAQVHRWTLKNNGMIFREEDWTRLKRIGTERSGVGCRKADASIQPKGIQTKIRSAHSALASTACFPLLRNHSSRLEDSGWDFTGRTRKIRWAYPPISSAPNGANIQRVARSSRSSLQ